MFRTSSSLWEGAEPQSGDFEFSEIVVAVALYFDGMGEDETEAA